MTSAKTLPASSPHIGSGSSQTPRIERRGTDQQRVQKLRRAELGDQQEEGAADRAAPVGRYRGLLGVDRDREHGVEADGLAEERGDRDERGRIGPDRDASPAMTIAAVPTISAGR